MKLTTYVNENYWTIKGKCAKVCKPSRPRDHELLPGPPFARCHSGKRIAGSHLPRGEVGRCGEALARRHPAGQRTGSLSGCDISWFGVNSEAFVSLILPFAKWVYKKKATYLVVCQR